jgi:hypothetical protein
MVLPVIMALWAGLVFKKKAAVASDLSYRGLSL